MSTERAIRERPDREVAAFETRGFYLACFLNGDGTSVRPLSFVATIKDLKGLLHNG